MAVKTAAMLSTGPSRTVLCPIYTDGGENFTPPADLPVSELSRELEDDVDRTLLRSALDRLPRKEQTIVSLRYGLGGGGEKTQKEVADLMGISQSYISRLEKRIIGKLREELARMA